MDDVVGSRFGLWVVIGDAGVCREKRRLCLVKCDCGNERVVHLRNLARGLSQSCGCKKRGVPQKHGMAYSPENYVWRQMRQRCGNPGHQNYARYGGRGIAVCERWRESFQNFLDDMGHRPTPLHTIDRIDNDGDYCPENCRWATRTQQSRNRMSNHRLSYYGESMTLMELGIVSGLGWSTIRKRIVEGGMTPEEATARPLSGYR